MKSKTMGCVISAPYIYLKGKRNEKDEKNINLWYSKYTANMLI